MKTLASRLTSTLGNKIRSIDSKAGATPRIEGSRWMAHRARILARDGWLCVHCLAKGRPQAAVEVDHIIPLEQGGSYKDANLQSLCHDCHAVKTATEQRARHGVGGQ